MNFGNDERGWLADLRRKYLHLQQGGTLEARDLDLIIPGAEECADQRDQLQSELEKMQAACKLLHASNRRLRGVLEREGQ